jgi:hypothetical protein
MHAGSAIFSLIATLTASEKRHFRIFAGRHVIGEENNYLELFDAIARFEGTDAGGFLDVPAHSNFVRNFTYNAHYLYQLILRSLQAYTYEATPIRKLRSMLDKMELLMDRQLYELAEKLYRKVVKEAEALEEYVIVLQALQSKRQWLRKQGEMDMWSKLPALYDKVSEVVKHLANENDIARCYAEVFLVTQNKINLNQADNEALQAILAHPILQDEAHVTTFNGRIAWHFIFAFTHTLKSRHALAKPHYRSIVDTWEAHPRQISLYQERYAMSIIDLLNCGHFLDDYSDFEASLAALRNLQRLPELVARRINWMTTNLEVLYYLNTVRLDAATEVVLRWEQVLNLNIDHVTEASILSYSFNICLLYFVKEDFGMALKWLNRILNHPRTLARSDVQRFARTFYLVVQIELGNLVLLETELASTRRALQQTSINALEKATLTLLGKLILRPRAEWKNHLLRFQGGLKTISASGSHYFGLQEIQLWVDARIANRSIADQLRLLLGQ